MSYDLMVFEAVKASRAPEAFLDWYKQQVEWAEDQDYSNAAVCSPKLQSFYQELSGLFPRMDVDDETFEAMEEAGTDNRLTDYSFGADFIYAAFAWSVADDAYTTMRTLALKHQVGFFNVSADANAEAEIIFP